MVAFLPSVEKRFIYIENVYITEDMGNSLLKDCLEIKRILVASINTAKENKQ